MKLQELFEAVSPSDQELLDASGYKKVDTITAGDYSMHLFKMPHKLHTPDDQSIQCEVALQYKDRSFTMPSDQFDKRKTETPNAAGALRKFRDKIMQWSRKYGPIAVSSYNPRNVKVYQRVFSSAGITPHQFDRGIPGFYISAK